MVKSVPTPSRHFPSQGKMTIARAKAEELRTAKEADYFA
jgi:hypothetical protein